MCRKFFTLYLLLKYKKIISVLFFEFTMHAWGPIVCENEIASFRQGKNCIVFPRRVNEREMRLNLKKKKSKLTGQFRFRQES